MKNIIRQRRQELNLSQVKVANLCGLACSAVSDFENEKRLPWPRAMKALCRVLKVSESELFPVEVKDGR
jgi:transcriptional regulator with XRE-family HTH domain